MFVKTFTVFAANEVFMSSAGHFKFAVVPKPLDGSQSDVTPFKKRSRENTMKFGEDVSVSFADKLHQWHTPASQTKVSMSQSNIPLARGV